MSIASTCVMVTPAVFVGTMNCAASPSTRADTRRVSACAPASTSTLSPLITYESPSFLAVVFMRATSQRIPSSLCAQVAMLEPSRRPGITLARNSAEPLRETVAATTFTGMIGPGDTRRPISSATIIKSAMPLPLIDPPPSASEINNVVQPSSAPERQYFASKPRSSRCCWRTVVSGHSLSKNLRVVSRKSSWSSESSISNVIPRLRRELRDQSDVSVLCRFRKHLALHFSSRSPQPPNCDMNN